MQSEQFDNKVKEAADHHHPAYDEQAWGRMEKLLDKHLPQKEDNNRRAIYFLLFFLLLGGGLWLYISKPWQAKNKIASSKPLETNTSTPGYHSTVGNNSTSSVAVPDVNTTTSTNIDKLQPASTTDPSPTTVVSATQPTTTSHQDRNYISSNEKTKPVLFSVTNGKTGKRAEKVINNSKTKPVTVTASEVQDATPVTTMISNAKKEPVSELTQSVVAQPNTVTLEKPEAKNEQIIAKTVTQEPLTNDPSAKEPDTKKKTPKNKKNNSLFFSLSGGPDLSFVGSGNSSTTKLLVGAGIGFTYKERFTLRTGFYSGRKVYSAKASDYKAPPSFYTFYPYLEKVEADCKVYEIPLSLSYNFGKKANWFVSAGVSSFLMKEESYNYFYKYTPTGTTHTNRWTINDENAHYFSVGTLSAGYKHKIGKRVTVMAEPYIKIPFAGVGYGKVKLNSGGVLFTVGIKAF